MSSGWPPPSLDSAVLQVMLQVGEQPASTDLTNNRINQQAPAQSRGHMKSLGNYNNHNLEAPSQLYRRPRSAGGGNTGFNPQALAQLNERPGSAESRSGNPFMQIVGQAPGQFGPIGLETNGFSSQAPGQADGQRRPVQSNNGEFSSQNLGQAASQHGPAQIIDSNDRFQMPPQANSWQNSATIERNGPNTQRLYQAIHQAQSQGNGATAARLQGLLLEDTQETRHGRSHSESGSHNPDPLYYNAGPSNGRVAAAAANVIDLTDGAPSPAQPRPYSVPNTPANSPLHDPDSILPSPEYLALFHQAAAACPGPYARPPAPPRIPSWAATANTTGPDPPIDGCIRSRLQQLRQQRLAAERGQPGGTAVAAMLAGQGGAWCLNGTAMRNGTDPQQPGQCVLQR